MGLIALLLRVMEAAPWAQITAMAIITAPMIATLSAAYRKVRNGIDRAGILERDEQPLRKKYVLFGPKTRLPKYFPGKKIPLQEFPRLELEDIKREIRTGEDRVDEMAQLGHKGGYVPTHVVAALQEAIQGEENKLHPERQVLDALKERNASYEARIAQLESRQVPYDEVVQKAEEVEKAANDAARRLAAEVSVATEAAKTVTDQVKTDPRVSEITEVQKEERKEEALAGFNVKEAVDRRMGRDSQQTNQNPETQATTQKQDGEQEQRTQRDESTSRRRPRMAWPKFLRGGPGRGGRS